MRIDSSVLPLFLLLGLLAGCGSGEGASGTSKGDPVGDPVEAIVGNWIFENEVGKLSYTFDAAGRFSTKSAGRIQNFSADGSYEVDSDGVTLYYDDMEVEEEDTEFLRFLDHDRLVEPASELIYHRKI